MSAGFMPRRPSLQEMVESGKAKQQLREGIERILTWIEEHDGVFDPERINDHFKSDASIQDLSKFRIRNPLDQAVSALLTLHSQDEVTTYTLEIFHNIPEEVVEYLVQEGARSVANSFTRYATDILNTTAGE